MFEFCTDPASLSGLRWFGCYLTTATHFSFYWSFGTVILLLLVTAPCALAFGFLGASAARSHVLPVSLLGRGYIAAVRGIPDIVFFLFFIIALDQGIEWFKHLLVCEDLSQPVWNNGEFRVCAAAKVPAGDAAPWVVKSSQWLPPSVVRMAPPPKIQPTLGFAIRIPVKARSLPTWPRAARPGLSAPFKVAARFQVAPLSVDLMTAGQAGPEQVPEPMASIVSCPA